LKKCAILTNFCNPGIRTSPIPGFGIGENGQDPGMIPGLQSLMATEATNAELHNVRAEPKNF